MCERFSVKPIENSKYSKVVKVREITGHGMLFCLEALKETGWDVDKAVEYLKNHPPMFLT